MGRIDSSHGHPQDDARADRYHACRWRGYPSPALVLPQSCLTLTQPLPTSCQHPANPQMPSFHYAFAMVPLYPSDGSEGRLWASGSPLRR